MTNRITDGKQWLETTRVDDAEVGLHEGQCADCGRTQPVRCLCGACLNQRETTTWQDWQKLAEIERANTAEAIRQLAAANTRIEAMLPFQSGWEEPDVTIVELEALLAAARVDAEALAKALKAAVDGLKEIKGVDFRLTPLMAVDYMQRKARETLAKLEANPTEVQP